MRGMRRRIFEKQLWAVFLLILVALQWGVASASSHIAKFVFITEPQSIKAGDISEELTIQAQDAAGNKATTTETTYLEFFSTPSGGEFLDASGKTVRNIMNRGTANRTFYYRDSAVGEFTLKVRATGKESLNSWEATQKITVEDPVSPPPAPPPPPPSAAANPSTFSVSPQPSPPPPPQPAAASSSPAVSSPAPETAMPPAGVREEVALMVVTIAATSAPAIVPTAAVPEAPLPLTRSAAGVHKEEAAAVAAILAVTAKPATGGSIPEATTTPAIASSGAGLFLGLAFGWSSIAAVGFLAFKRFFQGNG